MRTLRPYSHLPLLLLLAAISLANEAVAGDATIVADVASRQIAVRSDFTGAHTTLFGALPEKGDVIIVVSGPQKPMIVRKKERIWGMWLHRSYASFDNVPGFYWLASSRPLSDILPKDKAQAFSHSHEIGLMNIAVGAKGASQGVSQTEYKRALLALQVMDGAYSMESHPVTIMGDRLYVLHKQGVPSLVYNLAHTYSGYYAIGAILFAIFGGWTSAVLMQRR